MDEVKLFSYVVKVTDFDDSNDVKVFSYMVKITGCDDSIDVCFEESFRALMQTMRTNCGPGLESIVLNRTE